MGLWGLETTTAPHPSPTTELCSHTQCKGGRHPCKCFPGPGWASQRMGYLWGRGRGSRGLKGAWEFQST